MDAERGWIGRMGQVSHFLRTVGADRDEDGKFLVDGEVASFLGTAGNNVDVVIPATTCYFVNGNCCPLAAGLGMTSYGSRMVVI